MSSVFEIATIAAVLPMAIYATVLWWIDRWEPEPVKLVLCAVLWGACPAILLTLLLHDSTNAALKILCSDGSLLPGVLAGPIVEELSKGVGILLIFRVFHHEFDSRVDGIVYGSAIGFGFAAVENVVYFRQFAATHPDSLAIVIFFRAVAFGLNHACFTSLLGIALIQARYAKKRFAFSVWLVAGFLAAVGLHAVHNWLVAKERNDIAAALILDWTGVVWIGMTICLSLRRQKRWLVTYLKEEVSNGIVTPEAAADATRFLYRIRFGLLALIGPGRQSEVRIWRLCSELAQRRHQFDQSGGAPFYADEIQQLRKELKALHQSAVEAQQSAAQGG